MAWLTWIVCTLTEVSVGEEIPWSLIQLAPSEEVMRLQVHGVRFLDTSLKHGNFPTACLLCSLLAQCGGWEHRPYMAA